MSLLQQDACAELVSPRTELYAVPTGRPEALFQPSTALLCADDTARTLAELSQAPEYRRGHGALYSGVNQRQFDVSGLRRSLAGLPLPRTAEGRLAERSM
ncbi:transposase [Streptomyces xanthochromogenes]|uniref:transposase n=1 Tax=Streptomyces xanthochromogenes TaxID=67384 RepID=UPI00382140A5